MTTYMSYLLNGNYGWGEWPHATHRMSLQGAMLAEQVAKP